MTSTNEYQQLHNNLLAAAGRLRQEINTLLEPYGITHQQFNAMRILRDQMDDVRTTSFSTQDLRERLFDRSADASRLVDRLVDKGLVAKACCLSDSRRLDLCLTPAGLQLLDDIDRKQEAMEALFKPLTEEEAKILNSVLERFVS